MKFAHISRELRDQSARYGGIKHYLAAADALDKACSKFFTDQDLDALRQLNAAVSLAERYRKEFRGKDLVARTGIEPVFPA